MPLERVLQSHQEIGECGRRDGDILDKWHGTREPFKRCNVATTDGQLPIKFDLDSVERLHAAARMPAVSCGAPNRSFAPTGREPRSIGRLVFNQQQGLGLGRHEQRIFGIVVVRRLQCRRSSKSIAPGLNCRISCTAFAAASNESKNKAATPR